MAPVANIHNMQSPIVGALANMPPAVYLLKKSGPEILPKPAGLLKFGSKMGYLTGISSFWISHMTDKHSFTNLSPSGLKTLMGHTPAGGSFRCVDHYR